MKSEYYKEYYKLERSHWWFRVRADIIMARIGKVISKNPSFQILNVGAATGRTTELLQQFGEVTSIEYEKDCCEFLKQELNIQVINASVTELPFQDKTFDLVCAFDVIEHVEDDNKAVEEIVRVCKPNGMIVITIPAFMQLWSQHDVVNHHFRRYVMRQVKNMFKLHSGEPKYQSYFNTLLFPPIFLARLMGKWFPFLFKRKGAGSDFSMINEKSLVNKVLYFFFSIEKFLLKVIRFPFGVSIIYCWKKSEN